MTSTRHNSSSGKMKGGTVHVRLPHLQRFAEPAHDNTWREEPTTICGDILHAAHSEVERLSTGTQAPAASLGAMLGMVSYCYAKGLFSSAEIERELWCTPAFLAAFGEKLPTTQQIRTFRRQNRAAIVSVIEHAIEEFSRREPPIVREHVLADNADLTAPAQVLAQWLLDMASYSDALDSE